jgi:hypothetical protein
MQRITVIALLVSPRDDGQHALGSWLQTSRKDGPQAVHKADTH